MHLAATLLLTFSLVAAWEKSLNSISSLPESSIQILNTSVGGRLRFGRPWALPCYTSYSSSLSTREHAPDAAKCASINEEMDKSFSLIQDFGSYHNPSFGTCMSRNEKCVVSMKGFTGVQNETCYQGTVPVIYLDARDESDVQHALKFATKESTPVTVKNTGHDYKGRSTGVNTFAIW